MTVLLTAPHPSSDQPFDVAAHEVMCLMKRHAYELALAVHHLPHAFEGGSQPCLHWFDDSNDRVTINDASPLDLTTGKTLEAWVYPTATQSDWRMVIMQEGSESTSYALYANSERNVPLFGGLFSDSFRDLYGGSQLPVNTWTHLAGTYDGQTQRLFANGTQVAQRNQTGSMQTSSGALRIGSNSIWGEFFRGRIDEVRIYKRALSAQEIQADRNDPLPIPSAGTQLVGLNGVGFARQEEQAAATVGAASIPPDRRASAAKKPSADIQSSGGGSPINVRWKQKDLMGIDAKIDDAPELNADGAKPQNTAVVGYILIR
jgi:hypothetical protein